MLAEELGQAYINTMRWYYLSNFSRYKQSLERIPIFVVDKTDAIGADPALQRGTFRALIVTLCALICNSLRK